MALIVYNLFPTLAGTVAEWPEHARRAQRMGFNWLYVNPFSYPGFSGSLYAIREHRRLNPVLEPARPPGGLEALTLAVRAMRALGPEVMMDLVVNHVSKDSPLVAEHPAWFKRDASGDVASPSIADPDDANKITVWGDLAEIDNAGSTERESLWAFWEAWVDQALDWGFTGFRCDAAYKVPTELWSRLIARARSRHPRVVFLAETLGCTLEEMVALGDAGFDSFYNSFKWWNLEAPWFLEQHERLRRFAPSVAFPESHDTSRLAADTGGSEALSRQRYVLAALVSAGAQITIGYEFGFVRPLDVVKTRPADWEEPHFDLTGLMTRVNGLKHRHPLLSVEGVLKTLDWGGPDVTVLKRWSDERGTHRGVIVVNRSTNGAREVAVDRRELSPSAHLWRLVADHMPDGGAAVTDRLRLESSEVVLLADAL